jgi:hypothetical protein
LGHFTVKKWTELRTSLSSGGKRDSTASWIISFKGEECTSMLANSVMTVRKLNDPE